MIAALDSHYQAVRARIVAANPQRRVGGILEAQDWPAQDLVFEAFYALVLGAAPLGRHTYSPSALFVAHTVQWVWSVMGTDVDAGIRGRNRGDRYRTNHAMEQELLNALYPYFTEKKSWGIDGNGGVAGTPFSITDYIMWTPPTITTRVDQESGLVYGAASVAITDITEEIAA